MTCAWKDKETKQQCHKREYRTSKYCFAHKELAKTRWKELMTRNTEEQEKRYTEFTRIHDAAVEAGRKSAANHTPEPMIIGNQHELYKVDAGICGFAWVVHKPGNDSFSRWARKYADWGKHYYGGIQLWCFDYGQSMELKEEFCRAFAKTLTENGIEAYMGSRID